MIRFITGFFVTKYSYSINANHRAKPGANIDLEINLLFFTLLKIYTNGLTTLAQGNCYPY